MIEQVEESVDNGLVNLFDSHSEEETSPPTVQVGISNDNEESLMVAVSNTDETNNTESVVHGSESSQNFLHPFSAATLNNHRFKAPALPS